MTLKLDNQLSLENSIFFCIGCSDYTIRKICENLVFKNVWMLKTEGRNVKYILKYVKYVQHKCRLLQLTLIKFFISSPMTASVV